MMPKLILYTCITIIAVFLFCPADSLSNIPQRYENIPSAIISLSSGYVITVDKQHQKIYVFQKNGAFVKVFEAPCSTGKNPGAKQIAGDAKTPNGIFFVTRILRNPGPPEIYGSLALPLDYPTITDKKAGRNGTNIWIHGTTKPLLPTQSNGCVVLRDTDLQRLSDLIHFNKTPVVITESLKWIPQNQILPARSELEIILSTWNKAFIEGDIAALDALYLRGAEIKGKKRELLNDKAKYLKKLNRHFILQPRDISILQQDNNAVIIFDQIATVNSDNSFQGSYNKLVLEKIDNKWYVLDDVAVPTTTATSPRVSTTQTENKQSQVKSISAEPIEGLVTKWVSSWKSGDMKTYRSCYASSFRSKGMNLNDWVSHKHDVRQRSKNINIRIENLRITTDKNTATAVFTQHYSSPILNSKGSKKLELRKISGEWKIYQEIM